MGMDLFSHTTRIVIKDEVIAAEADLFAQSIMDGMVKKGRAG